MDSLSSSMKPTSPRLSRTVWDVSTSTCSLPDHKLPEAWQNDVRMGFLFAPFYPRETNPNGYDAKMKFWTEMLELWCAECRRATFSISLLAKAFRRKNVSPACLQTFVDELVRKGEIMTEDQFSSWDRTESWTTWAVKAVVKKPAVWSFAKLKEALIAVDPSQVKYVSITHLKTVGELLVQNFANDVESSVMTFAKFRELVGDDAEHVLRWLKNTGMASEILFSEERWLKIGSGSLVEGEVTKHKLKLEIEKLHESIDKLEETILSLVENARTNIRNNKREAAKRCLKEKRSSENKIKDISKVVDNMESLLSSLTDAKSNAEILNVYQLGVKALKAAHSGLSEDTVANTMSDLEDVLEMSQDVTRAMRLSDEAGDEELEAELESIVANNSSPPPGSPQQNTVSPVLPVLPDVPSSDPSPERRGPDLKSPVMSPS